MTPLAPGEQLLLVVPGPQYLISLLYTSMPPMRPPSLTLSPSFPFPHLLIFTGSTGPGRTDSKDLRKEEEEEEVWDTHTSI